MTKQEWQTNFRNARVAARHTATVKYRLAGQRAWAAGMAMMRKLQDEVAPTLTKMEQATAFLDKATAK